MPTYIWASPHKVIEYYLVGDTPPRFPTYEEGEKNLSEVVRAGRVTTKLGGIEFHPTLLEPSLRMYLELNQEETGHALPPDLELLVSDVEAIFFHGKKGAFRRGRPRKLKLDADDYVDVGRMAKMIDTGEAATKHAAAQVLARSVPVQQRSAKVKYLSRAFDTVFQARFFREERERGSNRVLLTARALQAPASQRRRKR
jgi:hypothetical protein